MAKDKNAPRYDKQGARRVMRKRDYLADLGGQLALGLMANLVGQLNYFYTDKVGLAVGSVGIVLAISKVIDAFTDVIAGNFIDHSKGGDHKYFRWILPQIIPAALIMVLMFTDSGRTDSGRNLRADYESGIVRRSLYLYCDPVCGSYDCTKQKLERERKYRAVPCGCQLWRWNADLHSHDPGDKYAGRHTVRMDQIRRGTWCTGICSVCNLLP